MKSNNNINNDFLSKALQWANERYQDIVLLNGNNCTNIEGVFPIVLAAGSIRKFVHRVSDNIDNLYVFQSQSSKTIYGYICYDFKNELEQDLLSENKAVIDWDLAVFIEPEIEIFITSENKIEILPYYLSDKILSEINQIIIQSDELSKTYILNNFQKDKYLHTVDNLKNNIQRGDIYEATFCVQELIKNVDINPINIYSSLNTATMMPFSAFVKTDNKFLICASPERFLKKSGLRLISQPIKGTSQRNFQNLEIDHQLKIELENSTKERAENIMIVDLVRNDLSTISVPGSVKVSELCKVYPFNNVYQMISTIEAELDPQYKWIDSIKKCFPMGSMTGAPKFAALQLIDQYENFKRSIFSGSVGYITQNCDFDFNVVIRSIQYDQVSKKIAIQAGSAITIDAQSDNEWQECQLKLKTIKNVLGILKD